VRFPQSAAPANSQHGPAGRSIDNDVSLAARWVQPIPQHFGVQAHLESIDPCKITLHPFDVLLINRGR
jgi:hypothetical protein